MSTVIVLDGNADLVDLVRQAVQPLVDELKGLIMTAREDIQALTSQLSKAHDEIVAELAALDAKIADGTVTADDLQPLKTLVQTLDDMNPDTPPASAPTTDTSSNVDVPANPGQL